MQTYVSKISIALVLVLALVATPACGDKPAEEGGGAKSYAKEGFAVFEEDGRLWVFREGSEGLKEYEKSGEPAKSVTSIGSGPDGKTIRSGDMETIKAYMDAK